MIFFYNTAGIAGGNTGKKFDNETFVSILGIVIDRLRYYCSFIISESGCCLQLAHALHWKATRFYSILPNKASLTTLCVRNLFLV